MGVNPTPTNYKTFTFAGENSRNYGVYITGEGVFNAPERNVEMIDIPGRNGAYALDKGNFNNVEVTYPASIVADTEADFAEAVSDLRNLLCSQTGYVRLEDDYNPNEYRMAIYKSGLEVSHDGLLTGEFDLTFDCKPQRYLKSGETAISITSGDSITNPTNFVSHPLIETEGYGLISFNGYNIELDNTVMGYVTFVENQSNGNSRKISIDTNLLDISEVGDTVDLLVQYEGYWGCDKNLATLNSVGVSSPPSGGGTIDYRLVGNNIYMNYMWLVQFTVGTDYTDFSTMELWINRTYQGSTYSVTMTASAKVKYENGSTISFEFTNDWTNPALQQGYIKSSPVARIVSASVDSTQPLLGHPTYIDCEFGEAYKYENGELILFNGQIDLGADLPKLASGANEITYGNTFTDVKFIPRWWKV